MGEIRATIKDTPKVVCPLCRGKFVMEAAEHVQVQPCRMCNGNRTIDPEIMCACGRPAVRSVGAELICTSEMCEKKAVEPTTESELNEENRKWWNEMKNRGIYP